MSDDKRRAKTQHIGTAGPLAGGGEQNPLASRARNRTVMLSPEVAGQVRALAGGEGEKAKPDSGGWERSIPQVSVDAQKEGAEGKPALFERPRGQGMGEFLKSNQPQERKPEASSEEATPPKHEAPKRDVHAPIQEARGRGDSRSIKIPSSPATPEPRSDAAQAKEVPSRSYDPLTQVGLGSPYPTGSRAASNATRTDSQSFRRPPQEAKREDARRDEPRREEPSREATRPPMSPDMRKPVDERPVRAQVEPQAPAREEHLREKPRFEEPARPVAPIHVEPVEPPPSQAKKPQSRVVGFLVSFDKDALGEVYDIRVGRKLITSRPTDHGEFILIDDKTVSPLHAIVRAAEDGKIQVLDQLSEFGTGVIKAGSTEEHDVTGAMVALQHGDTIRFGERKFIFASIPQAKK